MIISKMLENYLKKNNMYLVTGCAGFIGSHLAKYLALKNKLVVGIDMFKITDEKSLKLDRINNIKSELAQENKSHNFTYITLNICDNKKLNKLFKSYNFKKVIHLAASAGVRQSTLCSEEFIQNNILGFHNVINSCRDNNIEHLIYASSSSLYNKKTDDLTHESYNTSSPKSIYAYTKKANELIAHVYGKLYNIKTTGLRFFSVYGPYGREDMSYYKFTEAIVNSKTIILSNEGKNMRDFTYIDDIIEVINKIIDQKPKELYNIYNVGSEKPISIYNIIKKIETILSKKTKLKNTNKFVEDALHTASDSSLLKREFDISLDTNIDDGLEKFIKWYKEYIKN